MLGSAQQYQPIYQINFEAYFHNPHATLKDIHIFGAHVGYMQPTYSSHHHEYVRSQIRTVLTLFKTDALPSTPSARRMILDLKALTQDATASKPENKKVQVIDQDSLELVRSLLESKAAERVGLLNMANRSSVCGDVFNGSFAQEEGLACTTDLSASLLQYAKAHQGYAKKDSRGNTRPFYGKNAFGLTDVLYSNNKVYFRKNASEDCFDRLEEKSTFSVNIITSSGLRFNPESNQYYEILDFQSNETYTFETEMAMKVYFSIIYNQIATALLEKNDALVLSAFACGAYQNLPENIASIYRTILSMPEFIGKLKICFAIFKSEIPGNLEAFEKEFEAPLVALGEEDAKKIREFITEASQFSLPGPKVLPNHSEWKHAHYPSYPARSAPIHQSDPIFPESNWNDLNPLSQYQYGSNFPGHFEEMAVNRSIRTEYWWDHQTRPGQSQRWDEVSPPASDFFSRSVGMAILQLRKAYPKSAALWKKNEKDHGFNEAIGRANHLFSTMMTGMRVSLEHIFKDEKQAIIEEKMEPHQQERALRANEKQFRGLLEALRDCQDRVDRGLGKDSNQVSLYLPSQQDIHPDEKNPEVIERFSMQEVLCLVWHALTDNAYAKQADQEMQDWVSVKKQRMKDFFLLIEKTYKRFKNDCLAEVDWQRERNAYVFFLNKLIPNLNIIEDERALVLEAYLEGFNAFFVPVLQGLKADAEKRQLMQALFEAIQNRNALNLFEILDPERSIHHNLQNIYREQGSDPHSKSLDLLQQNVLGHFEFMPEGFDDAEFLRFLSLVRRQVSEKNNNRDKALLAIHEVILNDNEFSSDDEETEDSMLVFEASDSWETYASDLQFLGMIDNDLEKIPEILEKAFLSIQQEKVYIILKEDERQILQSLQSIVQTPYVKAKPTQMIRDFFQLWFSERENRMHSSRAKLHEFLSDSLVQDKLVWKDADLERYLSDEKDPNTEMASVDLYSLNRVLLQAFVQDPKDWSPVFALVFSECLYYVANPYQGMSTHEGFPSRLKWDETVFQGMIDREKDYPTHLIEQLSHYHHQNVKWSAPSRLLDNIYYILPGPVRLETLFQWLEIIKLLGLERASQYFISHTQNILGLYLAKAKQDGLQAIMQDLGSIPEAYFMAFIRMIEKDRLSSHPRPDWQDFDALLVERIASESKLEEYVLQHPRRRDIAVKFSEKYQVARDQTTQNYYRNLYLKIQPSLKDLIDKCISLFVRNQFKEAQKMLIDTYQGLSIGQKTSFYHAIFGSSFQSEIARWLGRVEGGWAVQKKLTKLHQESSCEIALKNSDYGLNGLGSFGGQLLQRSFFETVALSDLILADWKHLDETKIFRLFFCAMMQDSASWSPLFLEKLNQALETFKKGQYYTELAYRNQDEETRIHEILKQVESCIQHHANPDLPIHAYIKFPHLISTLSEWKNFILDCRDEQERAAFFLDYQSNLFPLISNAIEDNPSLHLLRTVIPAKLQKHFIRVLSEKAIQGMLDLASDEVFQDAEFVLQVITEGLQGSDRPWSISEKQLICDLFLQKIHTQGMILNSDQASAYLEVILRWNPSNLALARMLMVKDQQKDYVGMANLIDHYIPLLKDDLFNGNHFRIFDFSMELVCIYELALFTQFIQEEAGLGSVAWVSIENESKLLLAEKKRVFDMMRQENRLPKRLEVDLKNPRHLIAKFVESTHYHKLRFYIQNVLEQLQGSMKLSECLEANYRDLMQVEPKHFMIPATEVEFICQTPILGGLIVNRIIIHALFLPRQDWSPSFSFLFLKLLRSLPGNASLPLEEKSDQTAFFQLKNWSVKQDPKTQKAYQAFLKQLHYLIEPSAFEKRPWFPIFLNVQFEYAEEFVQHIDFVCGITSTDPVRANEARAQVTRLFRERSQTILLGFVQMIQEGRLSLEDAWKTYLPHGYDTQLLKILYQHFPSKNWFFDMSFVQQINYLIYIPGLQLLLSLDQKYQLEIATFVETLLNRDQHLIQSARPEGVEPERILFELKFVEAQLSASQEKIEKVAENYLQSIQEYHFSFDLDDFLRLCRTAGLSGLQANRRRLEIFANHLATFDPALEKALRLQFQKWERDLTKVSDDKMEASFSTSSRALISSRLSSFHASLRMTEGDVSLSQSSRQSSSGTLGVPSPFNEWV